MNDQLGPAKDLDLRTYILFLRRGWRWIALATVLCIILGFAYSVRQTPMYRASAVVTIKPTLAVDSFGNDASPAYIQSQIDLLKSADTQQRVAAVAGALASVSFSSESEKTPNIRITATSEQADATAATANAYTQVFAEINTEFELQRNKLAIDALNKRIKETQDELKKMGVDPSQQPSGTESVEAGDLRGQLRTYANQLSSLNDRAAFIQQGRVETLVRATVPGSPFSPNIPRNMSLALVLGIMLGVGVVLLRENLSDAVEGADELGALTGGVPLLGVIPIDRQHPKGTSEYVTVVDNPQSVVAESYRTFRVSLEFAQMDKPLNLLQVTSSRPADGKTTTATNLAATFARAGMNVLLVDLDLRRPRVHQHLGLDNKIGFCEVLSGKVSLAKAVQPNKKLPNLEVLTSGQLPRDPSETLNGAKARRLILSFTKSYDIVILDSPPVLGVSDPLIISSIVDALVLVIRAHEADRNDIRATYELLGKVNAPLVGTLVNRVDSRRGGSGNRYGGGYGYGYGYGYGAYGKNKSGYSYGYGYGYNEGQPSADASAR